MRRNQLDVTRSRLWVARLTGSLSLSTRSPATSSEPSSATSPPGRQPAFRRGTAAKGAELQAPHVSSDLACVVGRISMILHVTRA
jgi:hypothetical protein